MARLRGTMQDKTKTEGYAAREERRPKSEEGRREQNKTMMDVVRRAYISECREVIRSNTSRRHGLD